MLSTIPTELLVEIFSSLDYLTLKMLVLPVCRRFRNIILDPEVCGRGPLAKVLFRESTAGPLTCNPQRDVRNGAKISRAQTTDRAVATTDHDDDSDLNISIALERKYAVPAPAFSLHPALQLLRVCADAMHSASSSEITSPLDIDTIGFGTKSGFIPLRKSPMAHESVTSPAFDCIAYNLRDKNNPSLPKCCDATIQGLVDCSGEAKTVTLLKFVEKLVSNLVERKATVTRGGYLFEAICKEKNLRWDWEKRRYQVVLNLSV